MRLSERQILTVLSVLLAGGLFALVLHKGGANDVAETPPPFAGSVGPEGWNLSRVPSFGEPIEQRKLPGGIVIQVVAEGQGEPIPNGRPMDLQYRVFALDGTQRSRGVFPGLTLGARNQLPAVFMAGLVGIRMFEKRRLLVPADQVSSIPSLRIPAGGEVVFDLHPVELVTEDLIEGTGRAAERDQDITVHYEGRLEDGTVFESSHQRGVPAEFTLSTGSLIRGWLEGIPGMKVGGTRRLWIPYHLAYGPRRSGKIPPYSNLTFDIELIEVRGR